MTGNLHFYSTKNTVLFDSQKMSTNLLFHSTNLLTETELLIRNNGNLPFYSTRKNVLFAIYEYCKNFFTQDGFLLEEVKQFPQF